MKTVTVTGYRGCERVSATFIVHDEADFRRRVTEWERETDVTEWSRDSQ